MIRTAFEKCGVCIDINGYDKDKIRVPGFLNYSPPEKNEIRRTDPFTKEELDELEIEENKWMKERREMKKRKRKQAQKDRNTWLTALTHYRLNSLFGIKSYKSVYFQC